MQTRKIIGTYRDAVEWPHVHEMPMHPRFICFLSEMILTR